MSVFRPAIELPFIAEEPLCLSVRRNGFQESIHEIDVVVCDAVGRVVLAMGARESIVFPRSAMKPLQALALVEMLNGAVDVPAITAAEFALICASHNGEQFHADAVSGLLAKFDISPEALTCGAHWSLDQNTMIEQVRRMEHPEKLHNNCSGKHAGMLILAKLLTGSTEGYADFTHAAQQRILGVLEFMTGSDLMASALGIDGCGAPAYSAPLGNWARGFAMFAGGGVLPDARQQACATLRDAIAAEPAYIAGTDRACSAINAVYGDAITVKTGAEGVYALAFHELGLGAMLKTRDGSRRGAEVAIGVIIRAFGYPVDPSLNRYFNPILKNWAGTEVGDITVLNLSLG